MRMVDLIARKRQGGALSAAEIEWWIGGVVSGDVPDYQSSAMLMAICFSGMGREETVALTLAMARSGETIDLSGVEGPTVDKHSTGGVGDSTTLICAPIAAACGARVAKISGRGLGHTGGTVDKLEAIPGFDAGLSRERFLDVLGRIGMAVTGPTGNLVPADKLLYALRDVTATVESIPLIAASIMSKKLAAGASAIVLDVKFGNGAVMKDLAGATRLAEEMVAIGHNAGRRVVALLTDMNQPLGLTVGNSLDIAEAVRILRGEERGPLLDLSLELAAEMLLLSGIASTGEGAHRRAEVALADGSALATFRRFVEAQGGDGRVIDTPELLPQAELRQAVSATKSGWIASCDTVAIGNAAVVLGAGRATKDDTIDPAAGIVLTKRPGDRIERGETLAILHTGREDRIAFAAEALELAMEVAETPPAAGPLVRGRIAAPAA